jgi:hypothetical protein
MKVLRKIVQEYKNLVFEITARTHPVKPNVINDVPYISQFATPEYAEKVLREGIDLKTDPAWKTTGAITPEEYAKWAMCQCGIASATMALHFFGRDTPPLVSLSKDAFENSVYKEVGMDMSGLHYREFCEWIPKQGIHAVFYTRLSIRGIQYALARGQLVMVTVNPNIRGYETAPSDQKGGHLVLVTGYDREKNTISINNPSGFTRSNTQKGHVVSVKDFLRHYNHRGIVLSEDEK